MKVMLILVLSLLITGCGDKIETKIINKNIDDIEYGSDINLYDLVHIEDGEFITKNIKVNTDNLGKNVVEVDYYNHRKKKEKYFFDINIVDTKKPLLFASSTLKVKNGDEESFKKSCVGIDNHDKKMKCKISGQYDVNTNGEYNIKYTLTDKSGNTSSLDSKLIVVDEVSNKTTTKPKVNISDIISTHKNDNTSIGIDVSFWQDDIDFKKVKDAGVEFVFIRMGYGTDKEQVMDKKFKDNLKAAKEAGLDVGVYLYSYASNTKSAKKQAKWVIDNLKGEELELPIVFDWEEFLKFNQYDLNIVELNRVADAFLSTIEKSNYKPMLYSSKYYLEAIWDLPKYDVWLANYVDKTEYTGKYKVWQLSNNGKVDGIKTDVDIDILYK